ncbi:MAG: hypothetical protein Q9159_002420 [Coniocarpon cinnabarinum]
MPSTATSLRLLFTSTNSVYQDIVDAMKLTSLFTCSLFLSMTLYRLFFHRLRHFPGPKIAAVSKLWHAYHCLGGQNYRFLSDLHMKYGDFVRTGPNEITVFTLDVLVKLNGPGNKNLKSDWYDLLLPEFGVATIRDKKFHDQRRRFWTSGLGGKGMLVTLLHDLVTLQADGFVTELPIYQERIREHTAELTQIIRQAANRDEIVDFKCLSYYFAFDIMGLFAFDRSFNLVSDPQWRYAVHMLRNAFSILAPVSPVPWLAQIGFTFFKGRWIVKPWHGMIDWCRDRMMERVASDSLSKHDVSAGLVRDFQGKEHTPFNRHLLCGESIAAIVAGSDTVGSATSFLFYELAKHPEHQELIYKELQTIGEADDADGTSKLLALPHLAACINETLRFHHVIPTGGYRDTSEAGLVVSNTFIPPGTTIVSPRYILNRLESAFKRPNEWIPERWTSQPHLVKDARTHLPFALGRYTCPGKLLALSEMSILVSTLVSQFRFAFPPGDDGWRVEGLMRDQFTALPGQLDLVFEKR